MTTGISETSSASAKGSSVCLKPPMKKQRKENTEAEGGDEEETSTSSTASSSSATPPPHPPPAGVDNPPPPAPSTIILQPVVVSETGESYYQQVSLPHASALHRGLALSRGSSSSLDLMNGTHHLTHGTGLTSMGSGGAFVRSAAEVDSMAYHPTMGGIMRTVAPPPPPPPPPPGIITETPYLGDSVHPSLMGAPQLGRRHRMMRRQMMGHHHHHSNVYPGTHRRYYASAAAAAAAPYPPPPILNSRHLVLAKDPYGIPSSPPMIVSATPSLETAGEHHGTPSLIADTDSYSHGDSSSKEKLPRSKEQIKRPLTAYNFFYREERVKLLEQYQREQQQLEDADPANNNNKKGRRKKKNKMPLEKMTASVATRWKALDGKSRERYDKMAEEDKDRYNAEMRSVRERQRSALSELREGLEATVDQDTWQKYFSGRGQEARFR